MIYTIDRLKGIVAPLARKYELRAVYLFGSYARNEATEASDVDILIDCNGSKIKNLYDIGGFYEEVCIGIQKKVDLITTQALEQESTRRRTPSFLKNVRSEMVSIYE